MSIILLMDLGSGRNLCTSHILSNPSIRRFENCPVRGTRQAGIRRPVFVCPRRGSFISAIPLISVHFCARRLRDGRIVVLANSFSFASILFLPRRRRKGSGIVLANSANPDFRSRPPRRPQAPYWLLFESLLAQVR